MCHCPSKEQASRLRQGLEQWFAERRLELHPQKTKIVYRKDDSRRVNYPNEQFDFLGYTFRARMNRSPSSLSCHLAPIISETRA